ncbi:hypothetical protein [Ralstonia pseudosolanacearum]|uniref:Uncharacterized protein n=1 Tax=Ralstonia nicotianae (strain ATCC BAA-1114 / GMI1000) TaxID=267608 RepID=Q8XZB5_RALN1|nr:hypothetical protein [Ralstonia pseudosolanacearum]AST27079.1 hypothetical protein CDC45_07655 [Ralstonia pseudosolanacearum]MCQ4680788.1 hypothetical protein [Ralstonia pseudosolanacearum]MDC6286760.1 hypothetical protein [Ralstonia pseudosolanacearum]CAD15189.1 conserved hypothetical protein [Ralstonia pseudosolanacearum GMI1000]
MQVTINQEVQAQPADTVPAGNLTDGMTVTDAKGRSITLKRPALLAQFRLVEAAGDSATNAAYMNMIRPLLFVTAIDGEIAPPPTSKIQIEALIQRVGEEGYEAVAAALLAEMGTTTEEEEVAALKK